MIRTESVQLTSIKGVAFKQKLYAGGAGITIITTDDRAVFTVNKRDGSCVPYGTAKVDESIFTPAVTEEALNLTRSLPYKKLDIMSKLPADDHIEEIPLTQEAEVEVEDEKEAIVVIDSDEYKEFIAQYTDKTGKFSYQIMNKELMQFASRSSVVSKMIAEKADVDVIVRYIVRSKAANLANNNGMDEQMLTAFIDTFDSMNTRSAFKELNAYLRSRLSKGKK